AFYGDLWSSFGSGWPMITHEEQIKTNLSGSEEFFELETMRRTESIKKALTPEGTTQLSLFRSAISSTALLVTNLNT
ncbi:hypothetical protein K505DRAFT_235355, partial [Melanomma pulvis-pyrius CBS 109.77]